MPVRGGRRQRPRKPRLQRDVGQQDSGDRGERPRPHAGSVANAVEVRTPASRVTGEHKGPDTRDRTQAGTVDRASDGEKTGQQHVTAPQPDNGPSFRPSPAPGASRPLSEAAALGDAPAPRQVGDRIEDALEHRADVEGELARGEAAQPSGHRLVRTIVCLSVTGVSLYLVAPTLLETVGSWRSLSELEPAWLPVMAALQAASIAALWWLQRLAMHSRDWYAVATSQLAANGMSKVAPGGGAVGAALQYRMGLFVALFARQGADAGSRRPAAVGRTDRPARPQPHTPTCSPGARPAHPARARARPDSRNRRSALEIRARRQRGPLDLRLRDAARGAGRRRLHAAARTRPPRLLYGPAARSAPRHPWRPRLRRGRPDRHARARRPPGLARRARHLRLPAAHLLAPAAARSRRGGPAPQALPRSRSRSRRLTGGVRRPMRQPLP
jgi:hypothetical protein